MRLRKEVHTRTRFALESGIYWFNKMKGVEKGGNIMSSKPTKKFMQSKRIYEYYTYEYQRHFNLPLNRF